MMYKKIMFIFLILLTFCNINVIARDDRQYFTIYGDSENPQKAYEIKNELIASYQQLVLGLDSTDYSEALENYFSNQENITYQNHMLTVILGDGNGTVLEGEFKTDYCSKNPKEIETHFFFWELLGNH